MITKRLFHGLGRLGIGMSIVCASYAFAVDYVVNGNNTFVGPAPPGYPPAHLLGVTNDTLTVLLGGSLNDNNTVVSLEGGTSVTVNQGGALFSQLSTPVVAQATATNPYTIVNNGSITSLAGLPIALDLRLSLGSATITNYTTGIITGSILLPNNAASIVNIYGGTITGVINRGAAAPATVNILGTFALGGTLNNIDTIHVQTGGTVFSTNGNAINNFVTLTLDTGTTMNVNSAIGGATISNNGTLNLNAGGTMAVTTEFGGTGALNLNTNYTTTAPVTGTQTITLNNSTFTIANPTTYGSLNGGTGATTLTVDVPLTTTGPITNINTINGTGALNVVNPITGFNTLTLGANLTLNPGGSLASTVAGPGVVLNGNTLTVNSGTITSDITGAGNVVLNTNFSTAGNMNAITNLTVSSPNTFTMNPGNVVDVTGTFTNNGTVVVGTVPRVIAGGFVQNGTGTFSTTIASNPAVYGSMTAAGASSFAGAVNLTLNNSATIQNGMTFDIITSPGLNVVGNPTIIAPASATLSFSRVVAPNVYRLVANRVPFSNFVCTPGLGVSGALDQIQASGAATANQLLLLQRLDALPTSGDVCNALLRLSPETNGGTLLATMELNQLPLLKITRGLHSMRASNDYHMPTGYAAGDIADGRGTYGPFGFANNVTVKQKNGIPGFNALGAGFGLLADVPVTGGGPFCGSPFLTKVGVAGTYAGTRLRNSPNVMDSNITSWQGILYGSVDYNLFFLDFTIGWATNHYINTRHTFLGQNARGDFYGEQRASVMNLGLNLPMGNLELAPYFSVRNARIVQNSYVETGAPGENLSIRRRTASSQQGGGGVKLIDVSQVEDFLPEIHVLFLDELRRPNLNSTAVFVEGGPSFITVGRPLSKHSVVCGFSAEGIIVPGLIVRLAYDLESRNNFWNNYGSIQVRWIY